MHVVLQVNNLLANAGDECLYPGLGRFSRVWAIFPGGLDGKAYAYNVGDPGSIPGLGRSPGEGNGNPLKYSCLESPTDRGVL